MATLKIGNAHNESGQKFFASNDLTTNSTDLLWKGTRVLTEASFTVSGDFEGTGSADSPLSWKGFKVENAEGTVLSETVKTIKAGTNVTLSAQDGVLTIESEGGTEIDTNAMVRIYDATVGAETGVVTITDGTPVTDLRIGDEIRTPDGVYQKIKDSITTSGDPATSSINISGFTNPSNANGTYVFQSDKKWKHESENYWVTTSSNHWVISSMEAPAAPSAGLCYAPMNEGEMPWDVTSWQRVSSYGTPVLEQKTADTVVDNTIDLFEYASLPIDPANIVQSVNGNKPDASGNVTIETSSGGLTSVNTGSATNTGLTGNGTASSPISLDLSNYGTRNAISLTTFGGFTFKINATTAMSIGTDANVRIATHTYLAGNSEADVYFHGNATNTANGLVVLGADGKIPTNLYDAGSGGGTEIDWANVSAELIGFSADMEMSLNSPTRITIGGGELLINTSQLNLGEAGGTTINFNLTTLDDLKIYYVNEGTSATPNTAGGFVILDSTGKLPAVDGSQLTNLPAATVDLSNYSAETIKLTGTKKIQIAGGSATSGILDITTGDDGRPALTTPGLWSADIAGYLTTIHGGMQMDIYADSNQADVRIYAGGSPSSGSSNGNILLYGSDIKFNGNALNSANGLVKAEAGKLPALDGSKLTNLPAGTVDLSAYTGGINLNSTDDSAVAIKFNSGNPTYNAELSMSSSGVTLSGYGDVSLEHTGGSYLRLTSGETTLSSNASLTLSAGSRLTISASEGVYLGAAGLNAAGGFAIVGEDGKLPSSILPAMSSQTWTKAALNQSDFSTTDDTYGGSYKELDGICSVEVYDADGYKVEFDVKCDFTGNKTRVYIPSGLTADTISNWTLLYHAKTIA